MHGLDVNGFRSRAAHPNKHVVFLVTGARKLRFESASQQFGHHKMLSRGFCRDVILSLPPFLFVCGLAHCVVRPRAYAIRSSSKPRNLAFESRWTLWTAIALELLRRAQVRPVRRVCRRSWRPWRRSLRWVRRPCRRCIPCVPVAAAGAAAVPVASCASASNGSSADDSVKPQRRPESKQGKRLSPRDHFRFEFLVHFLSPCR